MEKDEVLYSYSDEGTVDVVDILIRDGDIKKVLAAEGIVTLEADEKGLVRIVVLVRKWSSPREEVEEVLKEIGTPY